MRLLLLPAAVLAVWTLVCAWYYFRQESVIFHPAPLPVAHEFEFERPFEEHRIPVDAGVELSALLFPATDAPEDPAPESGMFADARRAVLYLHGNAGHLQDWGWHAGLYVDSGYDFLVVDYRGYGKSDSSIEGEDQLHADMDRVWSWLTERYDPGRVTIVGYSLGAGLAARLACAAAPPPERLVLLAPFYSAEDLARRMVPFVPTFLLRYPLRTDRHLEDCDLPITIFHGTADRTIPIIQGRRLAEMLGERGRIVELPGTGHQDIVADPTFQREMHALLTGNARAIDALPTPEPQDGSHDLRD